MTLPSGFPTTVCSISRRQWALVVAASYPTAAKSQTVRIGRQALTTSQPKTHSSDEQPRQLPHFLQGNKKPTTCKFFHHSVVPSKNAIRHHHFELLNHQLTNIITKNPSSIHTHTYVHVNVLPKSYQCLKKISKRMSSSLEIIIFEEINVQAK